MSPSDIPAAVTTTTTLQPNYKTNHPSTRLSIAIQHHYHHHLNTIDTTLPLPSPPTYLTTTTNITKISQHPSPVHHTTITSTPAPGFDSCRLYVSLPQLLLLNLLVASPFILLHSPSSFFTFNSHTIHDCFLALKFCLFSTSYTLFLLLQLHQSHTIPYIIPLSYSLFPTPLHSPSFSLPLLRLTPAPSSPLHTLNSLSPVLIHSFIHSLLFSPSPSFCVIHPALPHLYLPYLTLYFPPSYLFSCFLSRFLYLHLSLLHSLSHKFLPRPPSPLPSLFLCLNLPLRHLLIFTNFPFRFRLFFFLSDLNSLSLA